MLPARIQEDSEKQLAHDLEGHVPLMRVLKLRRLTDRAWFFSQVVEVSFGLG
jgi:hypothetical protein